MDNETNYLIGGFVYSFNQLILPSLLEDYDIIATEVEQSVMIPDTNYEYQFRADLIGRHKASGIVEVFDYKTTKSVEWLKASKYGFTLQTALYTWAAEQLYGACRGMTYIVFAKGVQRYDKTLDATIRVSPYCYGYASPHGAVQTKWAKGFSRVPAWDHFSLDKWNTTVVSLEDRESTVRVLPQLSLDAHTRDQMIRSALRAEDRFRVHLQQGHPLVKNCNSCYKYGEDYRCAYYKLCYTNDGPEDDYVPRVDHHAQ